jgi:hypothetical protein
MITPPQIVAIGLGTSLTLSTSLQAQGEDPIIPGTGESSPSQFHSLTCINYTNQGPTEAQSLANLGFFLWINDEYGMTLDIYAFDAATIDAPRNYGKPSIRKFKEQQPNGFRHLANAADGFGERLGICLGPDGFGDTPAEKIEHIDLLSSLCRNHNFQLFEMDTVCGQLRDEKQDAFIRLMKGGSSKLTPFVWITARELPFTSTPVK